MRLQQALDYVDELSARLQQTKASFTTKLEISDNKATDLRELLSESERERSRLQGELREVQNAALRSLEKNQRAPLEDREVRQRMSKLEDRLKAWVRRYTVEDIATLETLSNEDTLGSMMTRVIIELDGYCLQEDWSELESRLPTLRKKLPFILSQAFLAKHILGRIFSCPFFFFPQEPSEPHSPSRSQLENLYENLQHIDPRGSHLWRSDLLFMLGKWEPGLSNQSESRIKLSFHELASRLAKLALHSPLQALLKPLSESKVLNRTTELQRITLDACELAFSLWTQRVFITCINFESEDLPVIQRLSPRIDYMTAHRLHHFDDDVDWKALNAVILTHPIIVAWGDENAENYDQYKVWSKAVVCVEEEPCK
ncbi:hypothetical protein BJY04DRAFT_199972 [Aspergillus karnatakaensis]|uniref:uncharacterized protein n=1 Tax=Aspergillus karnatakaensis TaxID=1810916 RepID=UPI003CCDBAF8